MEPDQAPGKQVKPATDSECDTTSKEEEEEDDITREPMPDSLKAGAELSHEAHKEEKAGNYFKAALLYMKTSEYFLYTLENHDPWEGDREDILQAIREYDQKAGELLSYVAERTHGKYRGGN